MLMLLLVVVSSSAMAEWIEVNNNPEGGMAYYVDRTTIRKSANLVKMLSLINSEKAWNEVRPIGTDPVHSLIIQNEYDCKLEQSRVLHSLSFSEKMGKGNLIESEVTLNSEWVGILPEEITYKRMWKLACEK